MLRKTIEILTGLGVTLETQHDFGCSVPACSNIFSHVPRVLLRIHGETSSQAEIADLQLTVCVDQKITGLEITMEDVCRVNVLETAKDLVDERLEVRIC